MVQLVPLIAFPCCPHSILPTCLFICLPGNGNKIIRCELSLDNGKSWRLADVTHRAAPNAYGKHWAWVWWSLEVPIGEWLFRWSLGMRALALLTWTGWQNAEQQGSSNQVPHAWLHWLA